MVVVCGPECKRFDSDTEGQEKFLLVAWDVDDNVDHHGRKKTCLVGQEVCLVWDRGGVLAGFLVIFIGFSVKFARSRSGSGTNCVGWVGCSWIWVVLHVAEALDGVQLQEVLELFRTAIGFIIFLKRA
jgi:hypothetical protein